MQLLQKLNAFTLECRRVLRVTRKPSSIEFKTILKVSSIGMLLIGAIGFILQIIKQLMII